MSGLEAPRPFAEPWEAQIFALVVALQDAGLFSPGEWADALGAAIRPADAPERPADYAQWLAALETILGTRRIADGALIDGRRDAFLRAAHATPHGQPILLENDPGSGGER
ncbi:nitrile hydratase accessory protein [Methylobacterium brachythecii]|uniref:Nitrile hydratase accessory protein n=1 Tax=Methylobacterium brachythecii TaxID=1176177 RepID=A0A7W6ADP5_9HYPH|nr:nitrile hydratase accessory protein [Methylobacterium brachythecii]MBB3901390.1 nitrile hydratase accessory protein [Methylobacterium brachythecii]GLS42965.1 nitrile hydratase accessory protein [Methylobacterium brachythecii]